MTCPPSVKDASCGTSLASDFVSMYFSIGRNQPSLPSWPTRDQSTSVASAKYVFTEAAAEILVCRLSQSMFDHLTVMPVCLVKASSAALGGGSVARTTLIVTPFVCVDAEELLPLPPPPQAVVTIRRPARPPAAAALRARLCRGRPVMVCLPSGRWT